MTQSEEQLVRVREVYADYSELPYVSPERNLEQWLSEVTIDASQKVPQRNMERTEEGLLPGHIILLWRISHGTFTNEYPYAKYFEYSYGINGEHAMEKLLSDGYAREYTAVESLRLLNASQLKALLREKGVKGYSKMKKAELVDSVAEAYAEGDLMSKFNLRGYLILDKGEAALENNQTIIDKHPQKKF